MISMIMALVAPLAAFGAALGAGKAANAPGTGVLPSSQ